MFDLVTALEGQAFSLHGNVRLKLLDLPVVEGWINGEIWT